MTLVGLAARNILRNKVRSGLTIVGIGIAMLTFVLLRTILGAWTSASEYAQKDRLVTRNKVTFVMTLPHKYADDVANLPGVKLVSFANWFGGKDPKHDREFFATLAVSKAHIDVYSEAPVARDQMETWQADRTGAIVGDILAKKMGWKIGDKVTLESGIFPNDPDKPWTFTIDGIYTTTAKSVDRSTFLFHWEYLNDSVPEGRKDQIGWVVARTNPGVNPADLGVSIDKMFESRDIQTLSQDERAFNASFLASMSAVLKALDIISLVILAVMMLVLGNTIAMGVRERTTEYGVLRALGFLPKHIVGFIVGESILTAIAGGGLGLLMAYPFVERGLGRWLEENMGQFFPYFRIATRDAILALMVSVVLGILSAFLPALGASRLKLVDALRRVA